MKTVHFVVDRSRIVDYLATPVRASRRRLRERGYHVRFFYRATANALKCDILCLASKAVFNLVEEKSIVIAEGDPTLDLLRRARDYAGKVVWLDSSDSTGVTHFELLPHVDLYLKKQLLNDLGRYRQPFYGGRPFSDYYHHHYGIMDSDPFDQFYPLPKEHEDKVHLSWNIGLGELAHAFTWWGRVRRLLPGLLPPRLGGPFTTPFNGRKQDIFLRASANWHRESVVYHRKELVRRLQEIMARQCLTGSVSRRTMDKHLSLRDYRRQIQQAKITFGPFGWGELNLREYEALMFGALLLRPDLSHMQTWPDIFHDNATCVFYRWDFADLEDKIIYYLAHEDERQQIAAAGQEAYRETVSPAGMERFSDWFVGQIEL